MLRLTHDTLELADNTQLWVDAEAFEQLLRQADAATDTEEAERLLLEAEALYQGSYLLEELYSEWATARRDTLQQAWSNTLLKLANLHAARGALHAAIETLERLRTADPSNETALRWLMAYLTQLHRRGEALQIYRQHAHMLRREYEGEPLPETRSLYIMLRQGRVPDEYLLSAEALSMAIRSSRASAPLSSLFPHPRLMRRSHSLVQTWQPQRQHQHPLLGRHQELEAMRSLLASFASPVINRQQPHFLLLTGDAGVGKTRLAEELGLAAYSQGWAVAWANSTEQAPPYQPWLTLLASLLPDPSPFTQKQERLHLWEAIRESLYSGMQAVSPLAHP